MTKDRRAWDPYAPAGTPAAAATPEPEPQQPESVEPPVDTSLLPEDLDDLRKPDLVALAEQHGLDSSGTKAEIIARLLAIQG